MALGTAFRAFFGSLFNSETSARVAAALEAPSTTGRIESAVAPEQAKAPKPPQAPEQPPAARRSEAVALLASLQREARLIDLVQEKLEQFSDAQVGAAARPCLQQCAATLQRVVGLEPVIAAAEGEPVEVPADGSPAAYQWIGEGSGDRGRLVHHGWRATRVALPEWTGNREDATVVAPAQIKRS